MYYDEDDDWLPVEIRSLKVPDLKELLGERGLSIAACSAGRALISCRMLPASVSYNGRWLCPAGTDCGRAAEHDLSCM